MDIDDFIKRNGEVINAELVVSWDARQTYAQYVEIVNDSAIDESDRLTEEGFLEYVTSNAVEFVRNTVESEGEDGLARITYLVDEYGSEIRAE